MEAERAPVVVAPGDARVIPVPTYSAVGLGLTMHCNSAGVNGGTDCGSRRVRVILDIPRLLVLAVVDNRPASPRPSHKAQGRC